MTQRDYILRHWMYGGTLALIWAATTYAFFTAQPQTITIEPETQDISQIVKDSLYKEPPYSR